MSQPASVVYKPFIYLLHTQCEIKSQHPFIIVKY